MHRWLLWTLLAVFCWGIWALLGKLIGEALSPALTQALSTLGLVPVIVVLVASCWYRQQQVGRPRGIGRTLPPDPDPRGEGGLPTAPLQWNVHGSRRRGALLALGAGTLTCLGNVAYYGALNHGAKAATVVPLTALYPVVTILLAVMVLKERLNLFQIVGIVLSLIAIYLFNVQQERGFLSAWLLVALIPVVLWGIAGLLQKLATHNIS